MVILMKLANQSKLDECRPKEEPKKAEAICDVCGDYVDMPGSEQKVVVGWAFGHRTSTGHRGIRLISDGKLVARI